MFCLFPILAVSINASEVLDAFQSTGYYEIWNEEQGEEYFTDVYSDFDQLIDFVNANQNWTQELYKADHSYMESDSNRPYGSPPIGYIDDTKSQKTKKVYFHFTEEYFTLLSKDHSEMISASRPFARLLNSLQEITRVSRKKFEEIIAAMHLSKAMHTEDGNLLILTKIVRYEPSPLSASSPHFDFSGFSLLFDNSEDYASESLLIAPYKDSLSIEDFSSPKRIYQRTQRTSSILLIPGLALKTLGVPITPTPHAVTKQNKKRYAIITFAMVPHVKLTYSEIRALEGIYRE